MQLMEYFAINHIKEQANETTERYNISHSHIIGLEAWEQMPIGQWQKNLEQVSVFKNKSFIK